MLDLEHNNNLFFLTGALLFIEFLIPLEYRAARISRDFLFPELFVINALDTNEEKILKHKARAYIDDQITHDSKYHYPWFLSALRDYAGDKQKMHEVQNGIEYIVKLRKPFYIGTGHEYAVITSL